ncbi:hypothetical protein Patl1_28082 [Pistacia atlantica]|uniref:Uncharacterized protein n=1 Tax=Pistacia atlantica TaxID=434234 RepID=A0ACC1BBM9_9ROSI|nr:hypothetical protein Patl1_28082 [Pistacia atlantica]
MLAEYSFICRSFRAAPALEEYEHNGEVDYTLGLHGKAASCGKSIALHGSWMALPLASAYLSTREDPTRFYGVDLDEHHVYTRTDRGDGLRETLFCQLFGKTC